MPLFRSEWQEPRYGGGAAEDRCLCPAAAWVLERAAQSDGGPGSCHKHAAETEEGRASANRCEAGEEGRWEAGEEGR